jgi:large-conductance mechanosensitive channel
MVLFALIKALNKMKRKKEDMVTPSVPELSLSEKLLTEIRDQLKAPTR